MSVVLITGCSSGIGLETALGFARRGDTVVATMRNIDKADTLRKRAANEGVEVHVEQLDVNSPESIEAAVALVIERHGTVDVLVNNAGISNTGPVETMSIENATHLMDTNFWGPMRTIRAALPTMRSQRSGVIVNVSSLASRIPATMYSGMYAASKQALNALSEALASEVEPFDIRVVSIEPGFFGTEIAANNISADELLNEAYAADQEWIRSFMESSVEGGDDPAVVAEAIVAAATDSTTPLHRPVGDDAAVYLDLLGQVDGYEGWMEAVTPIVEAAVGPRPPAR
jgi:NAD(P)-dependent dehydrogenase (short-subunit alcohol dehydrogenase family)